MRQTVIFLTIPLVVGADENQNAISENGKILPGMVCGYHPSPGGGTILYYTNGAVFATPLSMEQYEKLIEAFYREVQKGGGSGLKIVTAKDLIS